MFILECSLIDCNLQLGIFLSNHYDFVDDFLQFALAVSLLLKG